MKENIDESEPLIRDSSKNFHDNSPSKIQILPKSFLEYFCCCFYGTYDITTEEYNSYINLNNSVSIPYSQENSLHQKLLSDFNNLVNEITNENDENSLKKDGFQSENLCSDLNEKGIFALEFMNYFLKEYKSEAKKMLNDENFLFSSNCISLTYLIRLYLLLVNDKKKLNLALWTNKIIKCSRKELKNFCENYLKQNNILLIICAECFCFVFEKFILLNKKGGDMKNYMILNDLFLTSIECLRKTLKEYIKTDDIIQKLKTNLKKNIENT